MRPEEMADAARILDALADKIDDGSLKPNVRDARYLRGAAAALRALSPSTNQRTKHWVRFLDATDRSSEAPSVRPVAGR